MTEPWPSVVAETDRLGRIGAIVHIGAGEGAELPAYLATRAHRIVLVEPNRERLADLELRAADDDRVLILGLAVSGKTGRARLNLFNFPALSSLRSPSGLHELFPGLRKTGEPMVETLRLIDMLQQAGIDEADKNILVVDAPGEERQIVADLISSAWATQFAYLVLRTAAAPMYEGAAPASELVALLEKHGYRVSEQLGDDPDFPEIHLRLEPLVLENRRLAEMLELAKKESAEAVAAREASDHRAKLAEEKLADLETKQASIEKKYNEQRAALERRADELEQARSGLATEVEQLRHALKEEQKKLSGQADAISELRVRNAEMEEALTEGESRQRHVVEEVSRAEAQMEIVRDLILEARHDKPRQDNTPGRGAG